MSTRGSEGFQNTYTNNPKSRFVAEDLIAIDKNILHMTSMYVQTIFQGFYLKSLCLSCAVVTYQVTLR